MRDARLPSGPNRCKMRGAVGARLARILYDEDSPRRERIRAAPVTHANFKRRIHVVTLQELRARHSPEKQARIRAFTEELLKTFEANHEIYVNARKGLEAAEKDAAAEGPRAQARQSRGRQAQGRQGRGRRPRQGRGREEGILNPTVSFSLKTI